MTSLDSKMFEAFQVAFVCFCCVCHSSWGKIKIHGAPETKNPRLELLNLGTEIMETVTPLHRWVDHRGSPDPSASVRKKRTSLSHRGLYHSKKACQSTSAGRWV